MPETNLELLAPVQGGQMLARLEGQVVFVHGGIPGETVRIDTPLPKRGYLEADAIGVAVPKPARVVPPCPYFGENSRQRGSIDGSGWAEGPVCGGCQYQHINYAQQLAFKGTVLRDVLRRVGKILEAPVAEPVASPQPYEYRNKATWLITEDGEPAYHQARSHSPVPITGCDLLIPSLRTILEAVRHAAPEIGLAGLVRGIEVRVLEDGAGAEHGTLVLDLNPTTSAAEAHALAGALREVCPNVASVVGRHGHEEDAQVLEGEPRTLAAFLDEELSLSPTTFFQVNRPVAERMAEYVLEALGTVSGRQMLDVYCGAGTFTIPLARQADAVIALELDAGAVADARETIGRAGLENVTLLQGDAATNLKALLPGSIDAAVVDPPRSGCAPSVLRQLARIKAPRLVYVSCDAATLARDLRVLLDNGYALDGVRPFDLFPQTAHIESVAVLRLPRKFQVRR
jgi:23S rRNA (uracil1939-C5)-methyltransferase